MSRGKLYGVGVGAGDKELITLKALKTLKEADIIAIPKTQNGDKVAYDIVSEYINKKEIIEFLMPMSKDFEKLSKSYEEIVDSLEKKLNEGKNIAFITLGDPTIYSSYMQINEIITKRGYKTEIISAVTSFCAAAAKLNIPLCERDEPLIILPASYKNIKDLIKLKGTKVLMKANKEIPNVINMLEEENLIENSVMIECCGMENEKIYRNINDINNELSYFSIIIVKDKK